MFLSTLTGSGAGLILTTSFIIVSQYFNKKKGIAMSFSMLGDGLGTMLIPIVITYLVQEYAYFGAMVIMAGIELNLCAAGGLYRKPNIRTKDTSGNVDLNQDVNGKVVTSNLTVSGESIPHLDTGKKFKMPLTCSCILVKFPAFFLYALTVFAMSVCYNTYLTFLPALGRSLGHPIAPSAFLLSMVGLSDMIGALLSGVIYDRIFGPNKRLHSWRILFHVLSGIVAANISFFTPHMPSYVTLSVSVCLFAFLFSAFLNQRITVISDVLPVEHLGSGVGWTNFFHGLGQFGPAIGGRPLTRIM